MKIVSRAISDGKGGFYRDRQVIVDTPPAPDCFVVAGIPRGGTSMLAGILHRLNINMGPSESPTLDKGGNIAGYHEDKAFQHLTFDIIRKHYNLQPGEFDRAIDPVYLKGEFLQRLAWLVREREQRNQKWGLKDFGLYFWWNDFVRLCEGEIHIVKIDRNPDAVANSLYKSGNRQSRGLTLDDCRQIVTGWLEARALSDWAGPIISLQYEDILASPTRYVEQIANFAGVTPTQEAINFIKPKFPG